MKIFLAAFLSLYKKCREGVLTKFQAANVADDDFFTPSKVKIFYIRVAKIFKILPQIFQLAEYRETHFGSTVDVDFCDEGYLDTWVNSDLLPLPLDEKLANIFTRFFSFDP